MSLSQLGRPWQMKLVFKGWGQFGALNFTLKFPCEGRRTRPPFHDQLFQKPCSRHYFYLQALLAALSFHHLSGQQQAACLQSTTTRANFVNLRSRCAVITFVSHSAAVMYLCRFSMHSLSAIQIFWVLTMLYWVHFEIIGYVAIWVALSGSIYSRIGLFPSKSHLLVSRWEGDSKTNQPIRFQG